MTTSICILLRICFLIFLWIIPHHSKAFGCSTTSVQHKRTGEDVTIQFQARTVNSENSAIPVTNQILSNDDSPLLSVIYHNGVNKYTSTCNGCTFTGNAATGDLSIKLANLQSSSGGTYKHSITESSGEVKGCVTVYVLGVPEPATIQVDNNNIEGRNIKLTCSSKSTTKPQDPNLRLHYKWKVDNIDNPVDTRYTYSQSRHTLTINNLEKQDANTRFICEATESGSGVTGLTSASSDEYRINVLYGPDKCEINFKSPFTMREGSSSSKITCQSDCNPSCLYTWRNSSTGNIVSENGTLNMETVTRYQTGNYSCICKSTVAEMFPHNRTSSLQIIVEFASFYIEGHVGQKDITVDEYDTDVRFACQINSDLSTSIQIMFEDVILKEQYHSSHLTFASNSITCFDAGIYTCKRGNDQRPTLSASISLFVRCAPRPLQKIKRNITSPLYVPVTISFTTIAYPEPGPTGYLWHKEDRNVWTPLLSNTDVRISSTGLESNMTIFNVSQSDYGRYKVTVKNEIGIYEQYLYLTEEDSLKENVYTLQSKDTTWMIVGITLSLLSGVLVGYATCVTILLKRKYVRKGTPPQEDSNKQVAYINLAEGSTANTRQGDSGSSSSGHLNERDSVKLYTDLARYSKDSKTTYDVIEKMQK